MGQRGTAVYLFHNQSYIPGGAGTVDSVDSVAMGENNALTVFVFLAGQSVSVDVTVLGAALGAGFLPLPDPNATQKRITLSTAFDCLVGSDNLKIRLSNLSGTFQNGQGVTLLVQPYVSPGVRQRANYYDRNPVPKALGRNNTGVAPHATTTWASYTVPAGRRAYWELAMLTLMRDSVATGGGLVYSAVVYSPASGGSVTLAELLFDENSVGAQPAPQVVSGTGLMVTGDNLAIQDTDQSNGGSVAYGSAAKVTEFDA